MITEPKWKSYIATTNEPLFTPQQCQDIISAGHAEPRQDARVGSKVKSKAGTYDTKKDLPISVGFLFQKCLRCIKLLKGSCFNVMVIILVLMV